jgi:peptide/nickel transport system ATP-binding protein
MGKIIEEAPTKELFLNPRHPYTKGLINSMPDETKKSLTPISGQVPSIDSIPQGCAFHPRCPFVFDRCSKEIPDLYKVNGKDSHRSRCFLEIEN